MSMVSFFRYFFCNLIAIAILLYPSKTFAGITGYGTFFSTTTTAPSNTSNLNQDTPYSMRWTIDRFDSTYFSHDISSFNHEIMFKFAGNYRVSFSIPLQEVTGNNRRSIRGELYLNGNPIDIARAESSYIRDNNIHRRSSLHLSTLLSNISVNDVLELRVSKQTSEGGRLQLLEPNFFSSMLPPQRKLFF